MSGGQSERTALLPRTILDTRVHFIDNLRSTLIALVIFHHAALAFGGIGSWHYVSPFHPAESSLILSIFVAINQTYFMGMLFFLSGHFSAVSASRKTWAAFCVDKLKRLGIPMVVYTLLIHPLVLVIVWWSRHTPILPALSTYYRTLDGARGPVWFLATLLLFDLIYVTVRKFLHPPTFLIPNSAARYRVTAAVCITTVIVGSYFMRLWHPVLGVRRPLPPLGLQLAYALQYILAYIAGICLSSIEKYLLVSHSGRALALAYLFATISLVVAVNLIPHAFRIEWPFSIFYAVWNELCFYFIGTALHSFFHDSAHTTKRWGNTARYSYGAYLMHALVIVSLQILVDTAGGPGLVYGLLKTIVVGTLGVIFSWAAAWLLIRIPGVAKIV
ncbi:Acyltransferase 3 [Mycena venus]|uniref:Acyltransferase 3 n=1 Tax=Mycena venus TaxID=2733690 RepID=A0A8H6YLK1_9AGAR|nr:Acyltransferase 3 [Mycena venus]